MSLIDDIDDIFGAQLKGSNERVKIDCLDFKTIIISII